MGNRVPFPMALMASADFFYGLLSSRVWHKNVYYLYDIMFATAINGSIGYRRVCKKSALLSASVNFFRRMCISFVSCLYVDSYIIQKYA